MKELNKHILEDGISNLPIYEPPENDWTGIQRRLPLLELPDYEPPVDIWQGIEANLATIRDSTEPSIVRQPLFYKRIYFSYLAAASIILVFGICLFQLLKPVNVDENTIVTTEVIDNQISNLPFQESLDEEIIIAALCDKAIRECEKPEFIRLKNELKELTDTQVYLKSTLSAYHSDPDLLKQWVHLENERSGVLKKMIDFLN